MQKNVQKRFTNAESYDIIVHVNQMDLHYSELAFESVNQMDLHYSELDFGSINQINQNITGEHAHESN